MALASNPAFMPACRAYLVSIFQRRLCGQSDFIGCFGGAVNHSYHWYWVQWLGTQGRFWFTSTQDGGIYARHSASSWLLRWEP